MKSSLDRRVAVPAFLLTVSLLPSQALAGNYSMGGTCPSQGAWTQMALQQSEQIAQAIRQLKDNPACKGIDQVLLDLQSSQSQLQQSAPSSEAMRESDLESFPGEAQALKGAVMAGGTINQGASKMLLDRTLKAAAVSADLNAHSAGASVTGPSLGSGLIGARSKALTALFSKIAAPTQKGLQMISGVLQKLPEYDECLIGHPRQGLAILSGSIKTAAAFSAAGEGVGDQLGNAILNLSNMIRDRRFSKALRETDETEFWFSISCLLESTSKNYCDAENALDLMSYTRKSYLEAAKKNRNDINRDNPLDGYYLMVRDLPTISAWLQKVQFGAEPRLRADAGYKTKIWNQVTDLTNKTNDIAGYFSEQMILLRELTDSQSKKNQLFNILSDIVALLSGGSGASTDDSSQFFSTTINSSLLPFFLIGRDDIPKECRANSTGGYTMSWGDYIKTINNGKYVPEFNDPMALAEVIHQKVNWVLEQAGRKASNYFRERLVVNMPNLVNQTMSDQYLTVVKALQNVYNYLVRFEKRLIASGDPDAVLMVPSIRETKVKIQRVLKSYEDLRKLGEQMITTPTLTSDENVSPKVSAAAKKVIDAVFEEFVVWKQKDSYLTGALSTMIQKDFQMRIKMGLDMSQSQQDLLTITQQHLLDKLISVHGVDPTGNRDDLSQAQTINNRNLHVFEEIFSDTLYRMIVEMKSVVDGTGELGVQRALDQKFKQEKDAARTIFRFMPMLYPGTGSMGWLFSGTSVRSQHPDLFNRDSNMGKIHGGDDKYGSYAQVLAKFCTQTLAFEHRGTFKDVCKGVVLKSYYSQDGNSPLDIRYDEALSKAFYGKNGRHALQDSDNICAYNNYKIKNLVQWMKDQDTELLDDGSVQ